MSRLRNLIVALAGATFASLPPLQARAAAAGDDPAGAPVALRCAVQGSAAPVRVDAGAGPGRPPPQKIVVQNPGGAPLVDGEIDFTVSLASAAGFERPVAKVPTSLGPNESVQVAAAYRATRCQATFTPRRVRSGGRIQPLRP